MFDGGEGSIRGGRSERSSARLVLALLGVGLDDGDVGGDSLCAAMVAEGMVIVAASSKIKGLFID